MPYTISISNPKCQNSLHFFLIFFEFHSQEFNLEGINFSIPFISNSDNRDLQTKTK